MQRVTAAITLILLGAGAMAAAEIAVTPGALGSTVTVAPEETQLTVHGELDARDLHYIARTARRLSTLDLSDARIAPCSGAPLAVNLTSYPADALPAYVLAGLPLTEVKLPSTLTEISDGALMGTAITSIEIPRSVKRIGHAAFAACTELTGVAIPSTVSSVGRNAFQGCTALTQADVRTSSLGASAFEGCSALSFVALGSQVKEIAPRTFAMCGALEDVQFSPTLSAIGAESFAGTGLRSVDLSLHPMLSEIGARAFAVCPKLTEVRLPHSLSRMGEGVFFDCKALTDISLPARLTSIPALTLKGASALASLDGALAENVDSVGALAFAEVTGVAQITLPSTLTYLADGAMEGMTALTGINALDLTEVPALGQGVWAGINPENVCVVIPPDMEDAYLAMPQWCEFRYDASGITDASKPRGDSSMTLRRVGLTLTATAPRAIASGSLIGIDGSLLRKAAVSGGSASFDLSGLEVPAYIVSITFADGSAASAKLLNNLR